MLFYLLGDATMSKALINFTIPGGGGKLTSGRLVGAAVTGAVLIAAWNYSDKIPVIGIYAAQGKSIIRKALGFTG